MALMDREALHAQVQAQTGWAWQRRAILHALIDAGRVTEFKCQECHLDDSPFVWDVHRHALEPVVDHIQPRAQGGSDRLENFQLVHRKCNTLRAVLQPEALEHLRQCRLAEGGWRRAIDGRQPGWNRKVRADDRRGGRAPKLTPDQVVEVRARALAGENHEALALEFGVSRPTVYKAKWGKHPYTEAA